MVEAANGRTDLADVSTPQHREARPRRFHPVNGAIDRVPKLGAPAAYANQAIRDKLIDTKSFIARHGRTTTICLRSPAVGAGSGVRGRPLDRGGQRLSRKVANAEKIEMRAAR